MDTIGALMAVFIVLIIVFGAFRNKLLTLSSFILGLLFGGTAIGIAILSGVITVGDLAITGVGYLRQ